MKLSDYELSDFVRDPSFRNWVHKARKEDALFWDIWLVNHPEKVPLAEEAAMLVRGIRFNKKGTSAEEVSEEWKNLRLRVQRDQQAKQLPTATRFFRTFRQMAAVFLGLVIAGTALWYYTTYSGYHIHHTNYGQTVSVTLPDSSVVVLNGNTTLRYPKAWHARQDREVWLEGEAFLSVTHTQTDQRFMVHIPHQVSVEVLGTEFSVSSRKSGNRVVLSSGRVRLNLPDDEDETTEPPPYVLMRPGEMVQFKDRPADYIIREVNPAIYSSWKDNRFLFDDTSIREIALMLEENYGYKVQIANPALADRKLTGEIETDHPDILLTALSKSFNIQITKENNTVWLRDYK
jgi:transmembrane sensor